MDNENKKDGFDDLSYSSSSGGSGSAGSPQLGSCGSSTSGNVNYFYNVPGHNCSGSCCRVCYPWLWQWNPVQYWPAPAVHPHKCPVCDGRGVVDMGFYDGTKPDLAPGAVVPKEKCRSCFNGVVWS